MMVRGRLRLELAAVLLVAWAPLVLLGAVQQLTAGRPDPFLRDVSLHVRLLVAVPLLRVSQLALAYQSGRALFRLRAEGFVAIGDGERFDAVERRAQRLRHAFLPEIVMGGASLFVGFATIVGWLTPTGVVGGAAVSGLSASRAWFGFVALPLFVFLLCLSLWRWAVWIRTLASLACMPLRLEASHPDRRGGIGFLRLPSIFFNAPFMVAISSVLCASWSMQIRTQGVALEKFKGAFTAFIVLGELLAFAPLLLFTPALFLAATAGRREFGSLATEYVRRFRERWLGVASRENLLGARDLEALNDLSGVYRDTVRRMSPLVFGPRDLIVICALMLLPMLPLLLTGVPLEAVLQKLAKLILGAR